MVSVRAFVISMAVVFGGMVVHTEIVAEETLPPGLLPPNRIVKVSIREDPADPSSDITHTVSIGLAAVELQGYEVAWEAAYVVLRRIDAFGQVDASWSEEYPALDTPDGLWWIEHDDPFDPITEEFTVLPPMSGTAIAWDPSDDDMLYDLEGSTYTAPPQGPPFEVTGELTYTLVLDDGSNEPEADEEEVEVPIVSDEPYST